MINQAKKIAVTGGAGLIGSWLVERIAENHDAVVVIDDLSRGRMENLSAVGNKIDFREGNLENFDFASKALGDCDGVFHLASRAMGVGYARGNHLQILSHNERVSQNVLDALTCNPPKWVMISSSSCVYPDDGPETVSELPVFTDDPEKVNFGYGWAKRFLEQKARIFSAELGVPMMIVRPFNIYGERYHWVGEYSQAIPMIVKRVLDGENPVVIWGSGNQRRSYIHASDCAKMMYEIVARGYSSTPINLGTEETVSIRNLVSLICDVAGLSPGIATDLSKPEGRFIKSSNTSLLQTVLPDFRFSVDLTTGLSRMVNWYNETDFKGSQK